MLIPFAVGAGAAICTIFVHALALGAPMNFVRHVRRLGGAGAGTWTDLAITQWTWLKFSGSLAFGYLFRKHGRANEQSD